MVSANYSLIRTFNFEDTKHAEGEEATLQELKHLKPERHRLLVILSPKYLERLQCQPS